MWTLPQARVHACRGFRGGCADVRHRRAIARGAAGSGIGEGRGCTSGGCSEKPRNARRGAALVRGTVQRVPGPCDERGGDRMAGLSPTARAAMQRPSRRQFAATVLHASGLLGGLTRLRAQLVRDLRILAYHRVLTLADEDAFGFDADLVSASEAQFRAQMQLLARRFQPIRFADLIAAMDGGPSLPARAVIVTFDDGYDDNYTRAWPILRETGVPATFFVSTGHIDSGIVYAYDWLVHMILRTTAARLVIAEIDVDLPIPARPVDRRALAAMLLDRLKWRTADEQSAIITRLEQAWAMPRAEGHADCRPMTWDQLREMRASGMEIGSHGVWHNMLAKLPREAMREEIAGSKRTLDRELGGSVEVISYPVGGIDAYDAEVLQAARDAGYRIGCSYASGTHRMPLSSPFELKRLPVERHMDEAWFAALVGLPEAFSYPSRQRIG